MEDWYHEHEYEKYIRQYFTKYIKDHCAKTRYYGLDLRVIYRAEGKCYLTQNGYRDANTADTYDIITNKIKALGFKYHRENGVSISMNPQAFVKMYALLKLKGD